MNARLIFRLAAIYGLLALAPLYVVAPAMGLRGNPEAVWGFIGTALAMQGVYWTIGTDPVRYRALMPIAALAKLSFFVPVAVLYAQGSTGTLTFALATIDGVLALLFALCWRATPPA